MSPGVLPELDDISVAGVMEFVNTPSARLCCRQWAKHIRDSMQMEPQIRFHKALHESQDVALSYQHSAVLEAQGTEETISFHFLFMRDGTFSLEWFRQGQQREEDSEQQYGKWQVIGQNVKCLTAEGHCKGGNWNVPVAEVLTGKTKRENHCISGWEHAARRSTASLRVQPLEQAPRNINPHNVPMLLPDVDGDFVDIYAVYL
jgi:hypothetical protein